MSTEAIEQEELDWDRVRFGREVKRGVVLGLQAHQLVIVGITLVAAVVAIFAAGFPLGWVIAAVLVGIIGPMACLRWGGRSLLSWLRLLLGTALSRATGRGRYLAPVRRRELPSIDLAVDEDDEDGREPGYRSTFKGAKVVPGQPERFNLPGELNELLGYETPSGIAFVYDPVTSTAVMAAQVTSTSAFKLDSEDDQRSRIEAFADVLTALGAQDGIDSVQMTDQTSVISGAKMRDYYRTMIDRAPAGADGKPMAGEAINPFASAAYEQLVSGGGSNVHEGWFVIRLSRAKLKRAIRAAGGGIGGFMLIAENRKDGLMNIISETGSEARTWLNLRELSGLIRRSVDPAAAMEISEREDDFAGVAPAAAGPMIMDPSLSMVTTDSGVHRTWWVSEWPRKKAKLGFLSELVFAGDFRHTITLVGRPDSARKALRAVSSGQSDHASSTQIQEKTGRRVSLAHRLEGSDLDYREAQLTEGYGPLGIGCYITVSAENVRDLELFSAHIRNAATRAKVELRTLFGQQAQGFVACALPLGRGVQ